MIVELSMFAVGLWVYARATRAKDRIGRYALFAYAVLLLFSYIADRFSSPPSGTGDIVWPGIIAEAILLPWAWWFDRHREGRTDQSTRVVTPTISL